MPAAMKREAQCLTIDVPGARSARQRHPRSPMDGRATQTTMAAITVRGCPPPPGQCQPCVARRGPGMGVAGVAPNWRPLPAGTWAAVTTPLRRWVPAGGSLVVSRRCLELFRVAVGCGEALAPAWVTVGDMARATTGRRYRLVYLPRLPSSRHTFTFAVGIIRRHEWEALPGYERPRSASSRLLDRLAGMAERS